MGDLIVLSEHLADRSRSMQRVESTFFFELGCPFSYLAAERVERVLGEVEWIPVASLAPPGPRPRRRLASLRSQAERRAEELRLPLVWPDRFPVPFTAALRAAAYCAEVQAGSRFALAASRLAFCGGFDLDDPEILAEAAAAAGLPLEHCLAAARDPARDEVLNGTARGLLAKGLSDLPAVRVGRRWFQGEHAPDEAAALLRARAMYGRPLAG